MAAAPHARLGIRERQIMEVIYRLGRATVAEVNALLKGDGSGRVQR